MADTLNCVQALFDLNLLTLALTWDGDTVGTSKIGSSGVVLAVPTGDCYTPTGAGTIVGGLSVINIPFEAGGSEQPANTILLPGGSVTDGGTPSADQSIAEPNFPLDYTVDGAHEINLDAQGKSSNEPITSYEWYKITASRSGLIYISNDNPGWVYSMDGQLRMSDGGQPAPFYMHAGDSVLFRSTSSNNANIASSLPPSSSNLEVSCTLNVKKDIPDIFPDADDFGAGLFLGLFYDATRLAVYKGSVFIEPGTFYATDDRSVGEGELQVKCLTLETPSEGMNLALSWADDESGTNQTDEKYMNFNVSAPVSNTAIHSGNVGINIGIGISI